MEWVLGGFVARGVKAPGWIMLSAAAHGVLASSLTALSWPAVRPPTLEPMEVAVVVGAPASAPAPVVAPSGQALVAHPTATHRRGASHPKPSEGAAQTATPVAPVVVEQVEQVAAPAAPSGVVLPSARAAALSLMQPEASPIVDAGSEQPRGPVRAPELRTLEAALVADIGKVDRRPDPELKPRAGGGYSYRAHGFSVLIDPDGSVHMLDRDRAASWIFRPAAGLDGELAGFRFFQTVFDSYRRLDRAFGNDPYLSERRWFMERTRALRESMAEHYLDKRVHSERRD